MCSAAPPQRHRLAGWGRDRGPRTGSWDLFGAGYRGVRISAVYQQKKAAQRSPRGGGAHLDRRARRRLPATSRSASTAHVALLLEEPRAREARATSQLQPPVGELAPPPLSPPLPPAPTPTGPLAVPPPAPVALAPLPVVPAVRRCPRCSPSRRCPSCSLSRRCPWCCCHRRRTGRRGTGLLRRGRRQARTGKRRCWWRDRRRLSTRRVRARRSSFRSP